MAQQTLSGGTPRTRAEIEDEILAARERLAENLSDLINQVHPRAVVHNTVADAREFVAGEWDQLKGQFVGEKGVRTERVALVAAAAAGVVVFGFIINSIVRGR